MKNKHQIKTKSLRSFFNMPYIVFYGGWEGSFTIYISQINKCFSNRQLLFKLGNIFHIHNYFLNKQIVSKPIHKKPFKSRNLFQIHKLIRNCQIFFKSIKKLKIDKSFSNPQNNEKSTNLFEIYKWVRNWWIFFKPTNIQVQFLK